MPPTCKNKSPLRYPGGKTRAVKILDKYVQEYFPDRKILLSPFFGGGSFELHLKSGGFTVFGNDLFQPLSTFWGTLQSHPTELIERIREKMPLSKTSFAEMRQTILGETNPIEQSAMYFCINRASFSGATLCGGFSQEAAMKRLTFSSLEVLKKCNVSDITFSNLDCCEFLDCHPESRETLVFADPPYYIDNYIYGKDGDLHEQFNHKRLSEKLLVRKDWILTYNNCEMIRELYDGCRIFEERWSYGMNASKRSNEIIILPPALE